MRAVRGRGFRRPMIPPPSSSTSLWWSLYGSDRHSHRPTGAFTSRLSAGRSPFLLLGITTTASGLLCWRDFHPQERQLASLHLLDHLVGAQQNRWRHGKAERVGGLAVHDHLELGRKLHREITRLLAAQDAIHVGGEPTPLDLCLLDHCDRGA